MKRFCKTYRLHDLVAIKWLHKNLFQPRTVKFKLFVYYDYTSVHQVYAKLSQVVHHDYIESGFEARYILSTP